MRRLPPTVVLLALSAVGCRSFLPRDEEPLPVKQVEEPIVVASWAEPKSLPAGGGQVQILVRVQKQGGAPLPGVEVRLAASTGSLYSQGQILVTDQRGMTRDRLSTRRSARITLNARGTVYRFDLRVGDGVESEGSTRERQPLSP